ncbi:MAG: hypothetical protein IJX78_00425 [Bacilli bacterium]|nr:hypothetical protein [Bacilli bacterium]
MKNKIIDINKKSYIGIVLMLTVLIVVSIVITYIVPKGMFSTTTNSEGQVVVDYSEYIELPNKGGINILKGLLAPILILMSGDGISIIMLSLFLLVIAGAFQIMSDTYGMQVIVNKLVGKFKNNHKVLIALITLIFMIFGSFFGLFEEVLTLLPLIVILTITLGYDGYLGFLICIVATCFGFASGITNPFTVITASNIIGASPITNIWFRFLIFALMYGLLLIFIFIHIKKITKNPELSPTYKADQLKKENVVDIKEIPNNKRIFVTYVTLLLIILAAILVVTSIEAIRGYTVVFLIVIFLFGGLISGLIVNQNFKDTIASFAKGIISALPTIILVLMASSIKFILEEGMIIATIAHSISNLVAGKNIFVVALLIYVIVLILEFFISSSTAKAIFVMGILSVVSIDLSKEMLVLTYLFGDGYTNVLFPTSPVLLIGLSMIGMNYFTWLKNSKWLFVVNTIMIIGLLCLAVLIGY